MRRIAGTAKTLACTDSIIIATGSRDCEQHLRSSGVGGSIVASAIQDNRQLICSIISYFSSKWDPMLSTSRVCPAHCSKTAQRNEATHHSFFVCFVISLGAYDYAVFAHKLTSQQCCSISSSLLNEKNIITKSNNVLS